MKVKRGPNLKKPGHDQVYMYIKSYIRKIKLGRGSLKYMYM